MRHAKHVMLAALVALFLPVVGSSVATASTGATAWGSNSFSQLGTESSIHSLTPTTVKGLSEVAAVAAGANTSFGLLTNETLVSWGSGAKGALGNGSLSGNNGTVPAAVSGLTEVTAVSGGEASGLALRSNGTVWAWGTNQQGQLGQGSIMGPEFCKSLSQPCSPVPIEVPTLSHIVGISAGPGFDLAVSEAGVVYAWGENVGGQLGNGTTKGTVNCTIEGETVTLGCDPTPTAVSELSEAAAVATGYQEGVALLKGGTVKDWGTNSAGQLGNGTTTASTVPVSVSGLTEVTQISAGFKNVAALRSNNTVKSWGSNSHGALGTGSTEAELAFSTTPVAVGGLFALTEVTAIATGGSHTIALLSNKTLKAWGQNEDGEVGNGTTTPAIISPTAVLNAKEVSGIAAGPSHSLAFGAPAPIVESVSPTSGPTGGGTKVEIHGSNFSEVSAVKFAGNNATSFEVVSSSLIDAVTPAGAPGQAKITVTAARGTSDATVVFLYAPGGPIEFGRCEKMTKAGKYKNLACTETMAEGNFEWAPGAGTARSFSGTSSEAVLETVGKAKVKCKGSTITGEYNTPRSTANVVIVFTGCEEEGIGKCSSAGAAEGEVTTSALEGVLGFESKELTSPGLELKPTEGATQFTEFKCGTTTFNVRGAVVAQLTPANAMRVFFNFKLKQTKGKQKPESLEGGPTATLETSIAGGAYEQAGLSLIGTVGKSEGELEINTVV
jgi:alpha-tubulin suppressor-like RCC1 family protein